MFLKFFKTYFIGYAVVWSRYTYQLVEDFGFYISLQLDLLDCAYKVFLSFFLILFSSL